jgi:hypothetical protein
MELDPGILRQLTLGIVPPGIAAVVLFALVWWKRPKDGGADESLAAPASWRAFIVPLALAALYIIFHFVLFGRVTVPPKESIDWIPIVGLIAALATTRTIALQAHLAPPGRSAGLAAWLRLYAMEPVLYAAIGWLAAGNIHKTWTAREALVPLAGFALLTTLALAGGRRVCERRRGPVPPAVILVFAAGASQALVLGFSSLKLSQVAGLCAAFMGGALLVSFFRRGLSLAREGATVPIVITMTALYQGVLYTRTEHPWLYTILLAASLPLASLGRLPLRPQTRLLRAGYHLLPVVLALIPVAIAVGLALASDTGYEYE